MRNTCILVAASLSVFFQAHNPAPAWAAPILIDWAFNICGETYESYPGDTLPSGFDDSLFDWESGLGELSFFYHPASPGSSNIVAFFDHELSPGTTSFFTTIMASPAAPCRRARPGRSMSRVMSLVTSIPMFSPALSTTKMPCPKGLRMMRPLPLDGALRWTRINMPESDGA